MNMHESPLPTTPPPKGETSAPLSTGIEILAALSSLEKKDQPHQNVLADLCSCGYVELLNEEEYSAHRTSLEQVRAERMNLPAMRVSLQLTKGDLDTLAREVEEQSQAHLAWKHRAFTPENQLKAEQLALGEKQLELVGLKKSINELAARITLLESADPDSDEAELNKFVQTPAGYMRLSDLGRETLGNQGQDTSTGLDAAFPELPSTEGIDQSRPLAADATSGADTRDDHVAITARRKVLELLSNPTEVDISEECKAICSQYIANGQAALVKPLLADVEGRLESSFGELLKHACDELMSNLQEVAARSLLREHFAYAEADGGRIVLELAGKAIEDNDLGLALRFATRFYPYIPAAKVADLLKAVITRLDPEGFDDFETEIGEMVPYLGREFSRVADAVCEDLSSNGRFDRALQFLSDHEAALNQAAAIPATHLFWAALDSGDLVAAGNVVERFHSYFGSPHLKEMLERLAVQWDPQDFQTLRPLLEKAMSAPAPEYATLLESVHSQLMDSGQIDVAWSWMDQNRRHAGELLPAMVEKMADAYLASSDNNLDETVRLLAKYGNALKPAVLAKILGSLADQTGSSGYPALEGLLGRLGYHLRTHALLPGVASHIAHMMADQGAYSDACSLLLTCRHLLRENGGQLACEIAAKAANHGSLNLAGEMLTSFSGLIAPDSLSESVTRLVNAYEKRSEYEEAATLVIRSSHHLGDQLAIVLSEVAPVFVDNAQWAQIERLICVLGEPARRVFGVLVRRECTPAACPS